jgi:ABC-type phosphate transport system substrate-binding protein
MSTSRRDASTTQTRWARCRVMFLCVLLSLLWAPVSALADAVQIIVNPDQAHTPIDRTLLRAMFTMRLRQWPDGTPVHVFVLPDRDEATALFCRQQLGTYPYVMRSTWDRMVFTGTGLAPTVVGSEREMRERVRSTPGAIGYVHSADTSEMRRTSPRLLLAALSGYPHG